MNFKTIRVPLIAIRGDKYGNQVSGLLKQLGVHADFPLTGDNRWYLPIIDGDKIEIGVIEISPSSKTRLEERGYCIFDDAIEARKALSLEGFVV